MSYTPYPKYKDSGVEWLGDVPVGWGVKRLKFAATNTTSNVDKLTKDGEHDVFLCNYTDVYKNDVISNELALMQATATEKEIAQYSLDSECVIITKDSESWTDIAIPAYVKAGLKNVLCGYHLAIIKSGQIIGKYLYYILASNLINQQFQIAANGVTRFGLPQSGINNAWLPVAPLPEQQIIAAFLDQQCGHIDSLIEKKRRMLDLLDEKRRALITQAVTRGLDSSVPMKDSGVEWLGMVPVGWEVKKVRFLSQKIEQGWSPQCYNYPAEDKEWGVLKVGCVNGGKFKSSENKALPSSIEPIELYKIFEDDILMSRANTRELLGSVALVSNLSGKLILCDKLYRIKEEKTVSKKFFVYSLQSPFSRFQYEREATGTSGSMQNIGQDTLKSTHVPLPPLPEQQAIADYLDTQTTALDKQRKSIETSIELLREYRASLITHAVTGKIDVRNFSPAQ